MEKYGPRLSLAAAHPQPGAFLVYAGEAFRDLKTSIRHDGLDRIAKTPLDPYTKFKFGYYRSELDVFLEAIRRNISAGNLRYQRNREFLDFEMSVKMFRDKIERLERRAQAKADRDLDRIQAAAENLEENRGLGLIKPAAVLSAYYDRLVRAADADRGAEHLAVLKEHFDGGSWPEWVPSPWHLARFWGERIAEVNAALRRDASWLGATTVVCILAAAWYLFYFPEAWTTTLVAGAFLALGAVAGGAFTRVLWLGSVAERISARLRRVNKF
ncbi:MAG: hypothetical protein HY921_11220 [Elusimicrobia bacterium]|nr:hypothetical protein [Elusimicrobiota bacterium]